MIMGPVKLGLSVNNKVVKASRPSTIERTISSMGEFLNLPSSYSINVSGILNRIPAWDPNNYMLIQSNLIPSQAEIKHISSKVSSLKETPDTVPLNQNIVQVIPPTEEKVKPLQLSNPLTEGTELPLLEISKETKALVSNPLTYNTRFEDLIRLAIFKPRLDSKSWTGNVKTFYNNRCLITGISGEQTVLEAHHLFNRKDFPKLASNLMNSVYIRRINHLEFHKSYGNRVTPGNFVHYLNNLRKKEEYLQYKQNIVNLIAWVSKIEQKLTESTKDK